MNITGARRASEMTPELFSDMREVWMRLQCSPHVPSMNERPQTQVHHVPRCTVVIAHQVEGHGDVGVAVIQTQIVL